MDMQSGKRIKPLPTDEERLIATFQTGADLHQQISECAYYHAKTRGFAPGHELEDWLKAEKEIKVNGAYLE